MGGLKTNLIMIAVALAVLAALLFARRELMRAFEESEQDGNARQELDAGADL